MDTTTTPLLLPAKFTPNHILLADSDPPTSNASGDLIEPAETVAGATCTVPGPRRPASRGALTGDCGLRDEASICVAGHPDPRSGR